MDALGQLLALHEANPDNMQPSQLTNKFKQVLILNLFFFFVLNKFFFAYRFYPILQILNQKIHKHLRMMTVLMFTVLVVDDKHH
jgi:hypothetical protein